MSNLTTTSLSPSSAAAAAAAAAAIHEASVETFVSVVVSVPAFLASIIICWVLRHHWKSFVCRKCCQNPCRPVLKAIPIATQSDIVLSILLCLQTSDCLFALGFLLSPLNDNSFICTLQGLLLQLSGPCAMLFSMCLSIELWIVIRSMLHSSGRGGGG